MSQTQRVGAPPEAKNMRLVGHSDLQARSAYQPVIHRQGDRYIAYVGHHGGTSSVAKPVNPLTGQAENNGTSVIDVTDPKSPRYLSHIPGDEGLGEPGGAQMVRCATARRCRRAIPTRSTCCARSATRRMKSGTSPIRRAAKVSVISSNLVNTHKNWWECDTGIAYLVSGLKEWRTRRMTEIYDLSDPAKPVKIRDFGLVGQEPGATGTVPTELHGMISTGVKDNRIIFAYGTNRGGVVQIVDRQKLLTGPKEPTPENLRAPVIGQLELPLHGAHSALPLGKMKIAEFAKDIAGGSRNFIMIVDESLANECEARETRQMVFFVDATVESRPTVVSNFNVPEAGGSFCSRGGRFGSHSSKKAPRRCTTRRSRSSPGSMPAYARSNPRSVFAEGDRLLHPVDHQATTQRCIKVDGKDRCKVAIQSNNVETDDRGYIYVVDRANTGMHILELTGDARSAAGLK